MKSSKQLSLAAIIVASTVIVLFQNCSPAKISSDNQISNESGSGDLGSSAPPSSTPGSTPVSTPATTPTPVNGPVVSLSTTLINFGSLPFGDVSANKFVTMTNTGNADLRITNSSINSNYDYFHKDIFDTTCGNTLAPGQSCVYAIYFEAYITIKVTAILQITSNAVVSPSLVQLEGKGAP